MVCVEWGPMIDQAAPHLISVARGTGLYDRQLHQIHMTSAGSRSQSEQCL